MYASGAEPEKAEPAFAQKVIVRKDGIEVEMPPDIRNVCHSRGKCQNW